MVAAQTVPPALQAIFSDPEIEVDGLICPGRVSLVIGAPYEDLISKHHKPCVVTRFDKRIFWKTSPC